jgi:hypothetical protein
MLPAFLLAAALAAAEPADLADVYTAAVLAINKSHAAKPGTAAEDDLAARLPEEAAAALDALLAAEDSAAAGEALARCANAALDLDLEGDFDRIRARLDAAHPAEEKRIGTALSRPRFLLLGKDGVSRAYLERLAPVIEGILESYDRVFGFAEFSKVPGKKVRIRVHRVEAITRPPHFAPQFPFHSEIDFPVLAEERLTSPTKAGQFQLYGLCHEFGHLVAMMDRGDAKEDHHMWAHYCGLAVLDDLLAREPAPAWREGLRDGRWRNLAKERERLREAKPSLADADGVLRSLIDLHDLVGPRAIGAAINALDRKDERLRVKGVRYYTIAEIRDALLAAEKDEPRRKGIRALLTR